MRGGGGSEEQGAKHSKRANAQLGPSESLRVHQYVLGQRVTWGGAYMARDSAFFQQFAKESIVKSGGQRSEGMEDTVQSCNERVERTRRVSEEG